MRAVEETLNAGKQAIVLVPEIALTPLAVQRFLTRFPGQVGLIHSRLTPGERYDTWRRARAGVLPVIVGPRSALFTPLKNLGLVVMDECHDDSYYQREPAPSFSTQRVASGLLNCMPGFHHGIRHTRHLSAIFCPQGHLPTSDLIAPDHHTTRSNGRITGRPGLPPVEIVDMREELKAGGRSMFSRALQESLRHVLEAQEQAILFLNRRGTSTFIFCYDCGHSMRCPHCEIPLTFHSVENSLFLPPLRVQTAHAQELPKL